MTTPSASHLPLLQEIQELLDALRADAADSAFRRYLRGQTLETVRAHEPRLRDLLARFFPKRRRDLLVLLENTLAEAKAPELPNVAEGPPTGAVEAAMALHAIDIEAEKFERELHERFRELSDHHIFQWTTFYRDTITELFTKLMAVGEEGRERALLGAACRQIINHAREIFEKGYEYVRQRPLNNPLTKSVGGLQSFLGVPIEIYSNFTFNITDAAEAGRLRMICSTLLRGIIDGYGSVQFGKIRGWELLSEYPRAWVYTLAFLTADAAQSIVDLLEEDVQRLDEGELRGNLGTTALPVLSALDRMVAGQAGDNFCLPRLGQFLGDVGRLEISMSLPRGAARVRYLELHCYVSRASLDRRSLEESVGRGAHLIAASLPPDLRDWVRAHSALNASLVDTSAADSRAISERVLEVLNQEVAKHTGKTRKPEPITINLARTFPLEDPYQARYFFVRRDSVRDLLRAFERDTGVRLWCSVRRSGKTTASFDLGASTANAVVVNQTMEATGQYAESDRFARAFSSAMESGRQLPPSFFRDTVRACASDPAVGKLIFVLDEYETLFERMDAAADRDRELRYTVVQPLLNQMVGFSKDNLLIFVGQRPDSHYILMDQNQLSPYVKQDSFPLFRHLRGQANTEFAELLRKVLTERVEFDSEFVDAIYAETGGHPFLTVNVLRDFFQWVIDEGKHSDSLQFYKPHFRQFASARLTRDKLRRSDEYDLFRRIVMHALSEKTEVNDPWLFAIYRILQRIATENPRSLACTLTRFEEIAGPLAERLGWDAAHLLSTAMRANFLHENGKEVRPVIPVLARLAGTIQC